MLTRRHNHNVRNNASDGARPVWRKQRKLTNVVMSAASIIRTAREM